MGSLSITTSIGERFIVAFEDISKYDLDTIFSSKNRNSQKKLLVEVKRSENIAAQALEKLRKDLSEKVLCLVDRSDVETEISNIINAVYRTYSDSVSNGSFAEQLINAKISKYLKGLVTNDAVGFKIDIANNNVTVGYRYSNAYIESEFSRYYDSFLKKYNKTATGVQTGGLAIDANTEEINVSMSDYQKLLLKNQPLSTNQNPNIEFDSESCICPEDSPCCDINIGNAVSLVKLINEMKKIFVTKDSLTRSVESKIVKADVGKFKSLIIDDELHLKNIITNGEIKGSHITADRLTINTSEIELSDTTSDKYYKLYIDDSDLILKTTVNGVSIDKKFITVDKSKLDTGFLFYDKDLGMFISRKLEFLDDDNRIKVESLPDEVVLKNHILSENGKIKIDVLPEELIHIDENGEHSVVLDSDKSYIMLETPDGETKKISLIDITTGLINKEILPDVEIVWEDM